MSREYTFAGTPVAALNGPQRLSDVVATFAQVATLNVEVGPVETSGQCDSALTVLYKTPVAGNPTGLIMRHRYRSGKGEDKFPPIAVSDCGNAVIRLKPSGNFGLKMYLMIGGKFQNIAYTHPNPRGVQVTPDMLESLVSAAVYNFNQHMVDTTAYIYGETLPYDATSQMAWITVKRSPPKVSNGNIDKSSVYTLTSPDGTLLTRPERLLQSEERHFKVVDGLLCYITLFSNNGSGVQRGVRLTTRRVMDKPAGYTGGDLTSSCTTCMGSDSLMTTAWEYKSMQAHKAMDKLCHEHFM